MRQTVLYSVSVLFQQKQLSYFFINFFFVQKQSGGEISNPDSVPSRLCQMRVRFTCLVLFQALEPAAYCWSTTERQETTVRVSVGIKDKEVFPLRASCYYSALGAEQREMNVLCLLGHKTSCTHAYTGTYTHTHTHKHTHAE